MASTNFTDEVTHVPAAWANDVNALTYTIFDGAQTKIEALAALGILSMAKQDSASVEITGGSIDGVEIGAFVPATARFTDIDLIDAITRPTQGTNKDYVDGALVTLQNTLRGMAYQPANSVAISGGSINGVVIGANNPIPEGHFTTLSVSTSPVNPTDAVNRQYVDARFQSLPTLGSMSTQDASSVAITGGVLNAVTIGNNTPAIGTFSSLTVPRIHSQTGYGNIFLDDSNPGTSGSGIVLKADTVAPNISIQIGDVNGSFAVFSSSGTRLMYLVNDNRLLFGSVTDDTTSIIQTSGTISSGSVILSNSITLANQATTKNYVDTLVSTFDQRITNLTNQFNTLGSLAVQDGDSVVIEGGTIDGTVIGSISPTVGKFTTLVAEVITDPLSGASISLDPVSGYAMTFSSSNFNATKIRFSVPAGGAVDIKAGSSFIASFDVSGRTMLNGATDDGINTLQVQGGIRVTGVPELNGTHLTGIGSAVLGTNCPATNPANPFTWVKVVISGNDCWIPAFK